MSHPARGAWIEISEDQAIAARQQTRRSGLAEQIAQYPARLQAYTPDKLKAALESGGYEVRPLGRGKLKGVSFEDGGGFRVNFSDGGLLQYHPDQGSHHDGAYYGEYALVIEWAESVEEAEKFRVEDADVYELDAYDSADQLLHDMLSDLNR